MSYYTFRRVGKAVEIEYEGEVHFRWPLEGGYLQVFTEYFLGRLLGDRVAQSVYHYGLTVTVDLHPAEFHFVAPNLYHQIRPPFWARVISFFNKKAR